MPIRRLIGDPPPAPPREPPKPGSLAEEMERNGYIEFVSYVDDRTRPGARTLDQVMADERAAAGEPMDLLSAADHEAEARYQENHTATPPLLVVALERARQRARADLAPIPPRRVDDAAQRARQQEWEQTVAMQARILEIGTSPDPVLRDRLAAILDSLEDGEDDTPIEPLMMEQACIEHELFARGRAGKGLALPPGMSIADTRAAYREQERQRLIADTPIVAAPPRRRADEARFRQLAAAQSRVPEMPVTPAALRWFSVLVKLVITVCLVLGTGAVLVLLVYDDRTTESVLSGLALLGALAFGLWRVWRR